MKNIAMAKYMKAKVPGMEVPDEIIRRLQGVKRNQVADEGIKIACEQIEEFKEMKGVAGVHLMAIEWEHRVPEIAERAKSSQAERYKRINSICGQRMKKSFDRCR